MKNYLFIFLLSVSSLCAQETFSSVQRESIKDIIQAYINENPEVITTAFEKIQQKKLQDQIKRGKKLIEDNKNEIFDNSKDFQLFANELDKNKLNSMVIFMDPYCQHCRRFFHSILKFVNSSKDKELHSLKYIFKEIPVLGDESKIAIQAMHAAKKQGKYLEYTKAFFKTSKKYSIKDHTKLAQSLKLNIAKFNKEFESEELSLHIEGTQKLAAKLEISGAPTSIINDMIILGVINADDIKKIISQAQNKV